MRGSFWLMGRKLDNVCHTRAEREIVIEWGAGRGYNGSKNFWLCFVEGDVMAESTDNHERHKDTAAQGGVLVFE